MIRTVHLGRDVSINRSLSVAGPLPKSEGGHGLFCGKVNIETDGVFQGGVLGPVLFSRHVRSTLRSRGALLRPRCAAHRLGIFVSRAPLQCGLLWLVLMPVICYRLPAAARSGFLKAARLEKIDCYGGFTFKRLADIHGSASHSLRRPAINRVGASLSGSIDSSLGPSKTNNGPSAKSCHNI